MGVDGTDKEINAAEYGKSPPGDDYLVIGHESFGVVLEVGSAVDDLRPGDYVVATGETHSVQEFCELAFSHAGLNWQDHVKVDPDFYRPAEIHQLIGDASKAKRDFDWSTTVSFADLVRMMVDHDLAG